MALVIVATLLVAQVASAQTTYTITVQTNAPAYVSGQQIKIAGTVSPAPGPSTGVSVRVTNPVGHLVAIGDASVGATSGSYSYNFTAGGSAYWTTGTYTVNATWGAYPPTIFKTTTFAYNATATTTTTSTANTTTSTSPTTSSTMTSTTTSPTTTSVTTTSSSTKPSTSSTAVPEFPYQGMAVGLFVLAVALAYFLVRRSISVGHPAPPVR